MTLNIPEDESFLQEFIHLPIIVIRNKHPQGFGHNHNEAFTHCKSDYFIIVNPDIRFKADQLETFLATSPPAHCAASAPLIVSPEGKVEDSARRFPTPWSLILRFLTQKRPMQFNTSPDAPRLQSVDWLAGMFVRFNRQAYAEVKGFDTGYFLYYEDVDICLRLRSKGHQILLSNQSSVEHDAQKQSHKNLKYLRWHIASLLRYNLKHFRYLVMRALRNL